MRHAIPFDKNWKEIVTYLASDFIAFFIPDLYRIIDFSVEFEHLEQDFFSVLEQNDQQHQRKKTTDKLIKVKLLDDTTHYLFIHIEFQGEKGQNIAERMYRYYRRIEEKHGNAITALVIYTAHTVPKQHNEYVCEYFGSGIRYKFNTYQVRKQSEATLLASDNPFALVVLENLCVINTKGDAQRRFEYKKHLLELAERANYTREQAMFLHFFVLELMILPEDLEDEIRKQNSHHLNINPMKHTKNSHRILDRVIQHEFGVSMFQAMKETRTAQKEARTAQKEAEAAHRKVELAEKKARQEVLAAEKRAKEAEIAREKAELAEKRAKEADQKAKEQADETLKNTIIRSYQKLGLSIPQIVELTEQTIDKVESVLVSAKLIEK